MKKRILNIILAIVMVLGILPISAFASELSETLTCTEKGNSVTGTHFKLTTAYMDSDGTILGFGDIIESLNGEIITKIEGHCSYYPGSMVDLLPSSGSWEKVGDDKFEITGINSTFVTFYADTFSQYDTITIYYIEVSAHTYMDWDDSSKTLVEKTATAEKMTSSTASLANGGWYVVDGTVTVNNRIALASGGTAHIILKDGAKLTASAGIEVDAGQSLYIYGQADGTGALEATNGASDAGIGGGPSTAVGTVIINGGTVTATGGDAAAGIGSALSGSGGTVIINGGTVTANCSLNGAGIGGGYNASGATVTINGGTVTATGGWQGGAGIGGGIFGDGATVTINGGTVTAIGGNDDGTIGAGIGGGADCEDHGELSVNSALTIIAGDDENSAEKTTLDDYKSDRNPYIKVVKLAPTQRTVTLIGFEYDNSDTIIYTVGEGGSYELVPPEKEGYRFNRFELSEEEIEYVDIDEMHNLYIGEEVDCDFSVTAIYDEVVAVPEVMIEYDGGEHTPFVDTEAYTVVCGDVTAKDVGKYTVTLELNEDFVWAEDFDGELEWYIVNVEYYLTAAPTISENGTYNQRAFYMDGDTKVIVKEKIIDNNWTCTFGQWYLRSMMQYKMVDNKYDIRFISMLNGECFNKNNDGKLADYDYAGFIISIGEETFDPITTTIGYTSFLADGKDIGIADYSDNPNGTDFFFLANTTFAPDGIDANTEIKVTPFVKLMDSDMKLEGKTASFTLSQLIKE